MKTVKRIIAVVSLLLVIWIIGYLCMTGSRLLSNESNEEAIKGTFYQYNNKEYFLEITDTLEAKLYTQGIGKTLTYDNFDEYSNPLVINISTPNGDVTITRQIEYFK